MGDATSTAGSVEQVTVRLGTDGADLLTLAGVGDQNLLELQKQFPVRVTLRGEALALTGASAAVEKASVVAQRMIDAARRRDMIEPDDVIRMTLENGGETANGPRLVLPGVRKVIQGKTTAQSAYLQAMLEHDITIGIGPAGTGKTYLGVAAAVDALVRKRVRRIVLARPAVEAGESLGFLPGDMQQKVDPYLRPLYDALEDMMPSERVQKAIETRVIEIAPLAYMRGRTLADAFVILDEAQNATRAQMKMFLTRLGVNSRAVITGDKTQVDLPNRDDSGLFQIEKILPGIEGISFHYLTESDVIRHRIVREIVKAYAADPGSGARARAARGNPRRVEPPACASTWPARAPAGGSPAGRRAVPRSWRSVRRARGCRRFPSPSCLTRSCGGSTGDTWGAAGSPT
jgi:phosphate starvation-inducible PhoH-like protein